MRRTDIGTGIRVNTPAAGVPFSLTGGRISLCLTCPKTLNAFLRMFFVLVFLFGGIYFIQCSEPQFGEGFLQTALFIVLFSFLKCMFSSSSLLITRSDTAFLLLCFTSSYIEHFQLYEGLNSACVMIRLFHLM